MAAAIATPLAGGMAWLDYRDWRRVTDDLLGQVRRAVADCAPASECERRGAEIAGLRFSVGEYEQRISKIEHYLERHDESATHYRRNIDDCLSRLRELELKRQ